MRGRLGRAGHAGRSAVPVLPYRTPRAYDLLDVPAAAGRRVLLQWERLGVPLGPVLSVPVAAHGGSGAGRLQFFVAAGSAASLGGDLAGLGWAPDELDLRAVSGVVASETVLPPADSPRWMRAPDSERAASYPSAHLLLGSLAYACRRRPAGSVAGSA
jgi:hypothetical protein